MENILTGIQAYKQGIWEQTKDVEEAKKVFDFVTKYGEETCAADDNLSEEERKRKYPNLPSITKTPPPARKLEDGVYIVLSNNDVIRFGGEKTYPDFEKESVKGIGIKWGSRSLMVAMLDFQNGKELTLTGKEDTTGATGFYIEEYIDAVADWSGKANTEHLKLVGLNPKIRINTEMGWYIPSLGELYFIFLNLKAINEAIRFVGTGKEIAQDWYWSSTEISAAHAWNLGLTDGRATAWTTKATGKGRVRAVSAFIG